MPSATYPCESVLPIRQLLDFSFFHKVMAVWLLTGPCTVRPGRVLSRAVFSLFVNRLRSGEKTQVFVLNRSFETRDACALVNPSGWRMEQRSSAVRCAAFSAGMSRHPWLRSLFSIHWSKQSGTEKTHDNNAFVQHSDRGPHYPSIKATERLIEVGNVPSMGIVGAS